MFFPIHIFSQCERLFDIPYPNRYAHLDSLFGPSESNVASIKKILDCKTEALSRNEIRTAVYLDLRRYIVLHYNGAPQAELTTLMKNMLDIASGLNDRSLMVALYMRSAWQNLEQHNYTATFLDYLRSYELLKTIPAKENAGKNYQLYTIALLFYQFNDFRKAIEISSNLEQPVVDPLHQTLIANLQGMSYLHLEQYDSSRYWFNKALESKGMDAQMEQTWHGIIDGNIGNTWFLENEFDKALPFLLSGVEKTTATNNLDNASGFETILANIYLKQDQPQKAFTYLENARRHAYTSTNTNNFSKVYDGLSNYYRQMHNPGQALLFQDSMLFYKAMLDHDMDDKIKVQAEYKFENEKAVEESLRLQTETRHERSVRNLLIGLLFLLMIVVLLFYNRMTMRQSFRARQLELEKQKAKSELAAAQIQLDDFTRSLKEKNSLIDQFSIELENLQSHSTQQASSNQLEILTQLRQSAILTDDHWEIFRARFEKVHGGYLSRLRSKLPDLSPAETRFMALAKLDLTNKEMSGILGVSPDSIRMMRHRLRKKLNIVEEGSLEELISSI